MNPSEIYRHDRFYRDRESRAWQRKYFVVLALQELRRMFTRILIAAGALLVAALAHAAPVDDLASPSQEVRDAAARNLRGIFIGEARSRWEPVVAELKEGDSKESVLKRLQPYGVTPEGGHGSGRSFSESYRLDDTWVLHCSYRTSGSSGTLFRRELLESVRRVWVEPPKDFSGIWTTYFANGERSHEIQYTNGKYFGVFTSFHANGHKAVVQHYDSAGTNGKDTGYFPNGQLMYEGQYKNGSQAGTWIHYNEDGSVNTIRDYPGQ